MITETTLDLVKKNDIAKPDVVSGFILLANVCLDMVESGKFTNQNTNLFCLRAMTASIVLIGLYLIMVFLMSETTSTTWAPSTRRRN